MVLDTVDQETPEEEIAARVDYVRQSPEHRDWLVQLLPEALPLYSGRGTNAAIRMRGYVLAAFEQVGLPEAALRYVLAELESGRAPYLVAAAAKAVRGLERPAGHVLPYLLEAIGNIKYVDDALSFDGYWTRWPAPAQTTAVDEILETIAWLDTEAAPALPALQALACDRDVLSERARATLDSLLARLAMADAPSDKAHECCSGAVDAAREAAETKVTQRELPASVEFEDQDGCVLHFGELVGGRPSIVGFFYTRCDNPNKCSLTITKLARLQQALAAEGSLRQIQVLAITYDPAFDLPARLRAFGENRGVVFGPHDRFLRATSGFESLRQYFDLGVNFGPALVNIHRIELFVLDDKGRIAATFTRLQWDPEVVLRHARALAG